MLLTCMFPETGQTFSKHALNLIHFHSSNLYTAAPPLHCGTSEPNMHIANIFVVDETRGLYPAFVLFKLSTVREQLDLEFFGNSTIIYLELNRVLV